MSVSHLADKWAFAAPYMEMSYGNQLLASGSGFFWKLNERFFLVSNWHNFSGRDPQSGQAISPTGGLPSHMTLWCFKQDAEADAAGFFPITITPVRLALYEDDLSNPRWLEHPELGRKVDVAAIDVSKAVAGLVVNSVNDLEADAVLGSGLTT